MAIDNMVRLGKMYVPQAETCMPTTVATVKETEEKNMDVLAISVLR